nr:hypothetical protein B0A51_17901 [Rachicladosporium sp. CCFEE 5018]
MVALTHYVAALTAAFMTAVSANESPVLFCSQGDGGKCGVFATYTNEKIRQTAGFWYNADITDNIGYNPTGKSINLKNPTSKTGATRGDLEYLGGRCRNEFGWAKLDLTESNKFYYENLPDILG